MSAFNAIAWAREQPIKPAGAKFVLFTLASHLGKNKMAFPGLETIAAETSQSKRTVQRHLRYLEAEGLINRHPKAVSSSKCRGMLDGYSFNMEDRKPGAFEDESNCEFNKSQNIENDDKSVDSKIVEHDDKVSPYPSLQDDNKSGPCDRHNDNKCLTRRHSGRDTVTEMTQSLYIGNEKRNKKEMGFSSEPEKVWTIHDSQEIHQGIECLRLENGKFSFLIDRSLELEAKHIVSEFGDGVSRLRNAIGEDSYGSWFGDCIWGGKDSVVVKVASPFKRDWIIDHFEDRVREAFGVRRVKVQTFARAA